MVAMFTLLCCGCDIDMKFRPRMFPPTDLGVWQIGIRAIDYSELVISLKVKLQTIVSKAGQVLWISIITLQLILLKI